MRIKKVQLKAYKRFDDLTIDLGENPRKIVALVGPNGCGKSSVFDAFEEISKSCGKSGGSEKQDYFSKGAYSENVALSGYNRVDNIKIESVNPSQQLGRSSFLIRSAYRYTASINAGTVRKLPDIFEDQNRPTVMYALDGRLSENYERLYGNLYMEWQHGNMTGPQTRDHYIGQINKVLNNILDIEIHDLGDIVGGKGEFYFKKDNTKNFPYKILSSGEKEVVDIIMDLLIKKEDYNDTVYCIDEPELHLNTAIQRKLLIEIEKIVPENCQLWIATHSIGFLRSLQSELGEKAQILDFSNGDFFNGSKIIKPMAPSRSNWQRIFSTALEDLTGLVAPRRIIYCEGLDKPGKDREERGFDAQVFNNIFNEKYPETLFVSSGGNTELDQRAAVAMAVLGKVFPDLEIWILKDRDFDSGNPVDEAKRQHYLLNNDDTHRVIRRFEIENYLFDKEVLEKYCIQNGLVFDSSKYCATVADINNQNVKDKTEMIKRACGITHSLKSELFKINLSKVVTPEMDVFKELEKCIFERK